MFIAKLLELIFGCRHNRTTFPLSVKGHKEYIVCIQCGKEFEYDWENNIRGKARSNVLNTKPETSVEA